MLWLLDLIGVSQPRFADFFESTSRFHHVLIETEKALRKEGIWSGSAGGKRFFTTETQYGSGIEDDHTPFEDRKVAILHMIASPFPRVWHSPDDNKAALDFKTIENLNRIVRVYIVRYLQIMGVLNFLYIL